MLMFNVLEKYNILETVLRVDVIESGIINRTFYVKTKNGNFVLQLIQNKLFKKPQLALDNISKIMDFYDRFKDKEKLPYDIELVESVDNEEGITINKTYWSCYRVPENATMHHFPINETMVYNIGKAIGQFHHFFKDFPVKELNITIPHHHDPYRDCKKLLRYIYKEKREKTLFMFNESIFPIRRQKDMKLITDLLAKEEIPTRVIHNNLRPNNFLFNEKDHSVMALIGYDAIMPGSWLHDFGEAARYFVSTISSDDPTYACINYDYFKCFTKGYLEAVIDDITDKEFEHLVDALRLMALERGLKYLNDYIVGNKLFNVEYEEENLDKARRQYKIVTEVENNYEKLKGIVREVREEIEKSRAS